MNGETLFPSGNNVLRTIHGVGEMMTQMVMSRGVPHILPDTPPSLRYGKGYFLSDNEDVMVMDTKLKIIEILQVSAPCWTDSLLKQLEFPETPGFSVVLILGCLLFPPSVHSEREVGLQDYVLTVHLQERVWRQ